MLNKTSDIIFIGKKSLITYVTTITQLAIMPIITIKARGFSMGPVGVPQIEISLKRTSV